MTEQERAEIRKECARRHGEYLLWLSGQDEDRQRNDHEDELWERYLEENNAEIVQYSDVETNYIGTTYIGEIIDRDEAARREAEG